MKKITYFISVLFLLSFSSCKIENKKDWFCICRNVTTGTEISRSTIFDAIESDAEVACNQNDLLTLGGVSIDCELE